MYPEFSVHALSILAAGSLPQWMTNTYLFAGVFIGFSIIIFVHELGHFLAAKWMGVRVDRFAVGFLYRLVGYRKGEGITFGNRPDYTPEELAAKGYGETDYCLKALPFGGYVKMLGQDDIIINEETGEMKTSDDPRAFTNKPVGRRMVVISAGVIFNLLFAVVAYALVFLTWGKPVHAPAVGMVQPGSPAASAGLVAGDRILSVNDEPVETFSDIRMKVILSDGPVRLQVERDSARLPEPIVVTPIEENDQRSMGIYPMTTTTLAAVPRTGPAAGDQVDGPQPGDRITQVDGVDVRTGYDVFVAVQQCGGKPIDLTVERAGPEGGQTQSLTFSQWPQLQIYSAAENPESQVEAVDSRHILGMCRRRRIEQVEPGTPAEQAGVQANDVVVQWGNVLNPTFSEIKESIASSGGSPLPMVVRRGDDLVDLQITPRRPFSLLRPAPYRAGVVFGAEEWRPVIADVVADTPAAEVGFPRGAELISLAGEPVANWFEVVESLKSHAGESIAVSYRTGGDEVQDTMTVPSSMVNELGLPPTATILTIDGEKRVMLKSGREVKLPAHVAVQKLLERNIGRTVTVEYARSLQDPQPRTEQFAVRADNTDPWQLRINYSYMLIDFFTPETVRIGAGGNPAKAVWLGLEETGSALGRVYEMVRGLAQRKASMNNVAGPVGIFQIAFRQAESGVGDLLDFLAFISINLAVINFLPLPVVDGGLMVFLLLEKIRGKPVSLRVQVTTTLIGLALIVGVFLFVTFQDITRLF